MTVDPMKLKGRGSAASVSSMVFPIEEPTRADFGLWKETIALLTSSTMRLSPRLGKYLRRPYETTVWYTNSERSCVLCSIEGQCPLLYLPVEVTHSTRGRQTYRLSIDSPSDATLLKSCSYIASVRLVSPTSVVVHSASALEETPPITRATSLRTMLKAMIPCSFLSGFSITGDGKWILRAFRKGSLTACHDGSFMPDLHGHYCAAATLFLCKTSGKMATITYCEKTENDIASNYRAELIGGVIATLVFRILSKLVPHQEKHTYEIQCDNMGVVGHGNKLFWSLPERHTSRPYYITAAQHNPIPPTDNILSRIRTS